MYKYCYFKLLKSINIVIIIYMSKWIKIIIILLHSDSINYLLLLKVMKKKKNE